MGMRFVIATVAAALVAAAAGCSTARVEVDPGNGRQEAAGTWRRLPDAPLSARDHAVVVGVGERMLVVGGWEFLCPPGGDCAAPDAPLLDDGAVYDRTTDSWSTITQPPFGVRRTEYATSALNGSAYLVTGCGNGPMCDAQPRLLSYDLAADRWTDHGPVPGPKHYRHLTTIGRSLLVYSGSDELGEVAARRCRQVRYELLCCEHHDERQHHPPDPASDPSRPWAARSAQPQCFADDGPSEGALLSPHQGDDEEELPEQAGGEAGDER